jgi:hypothetical protein
MSEGLSISRMAAGVFYDGASLTRVIVDMLETGIPTAALGVIGAAVDELAEDIRRFAHRPGQDGPAPLSLFQPATLAELLAHLDAGAALVWVAAPTNALLDHALRVLLAHSSHLVHGEQIAVQTA